MLNILNSVMEHALHEDERLFDLNSIDFTEEPKQPSKSIRKELVMVATNSLKIGDIAFVQGTLASLTEDTIVILEGLTTKGEKVRDRSYTYTTTDGLVIPLANVTFNSEPLMETDIIEDNSLPVNINLIRYITTYFKVNEFTYSLKMDKGTRAIHVGKWDNEGNKLYVAVHKGVNLAMSYEKFAVHVETLEPIFQLSYEGDKAREQPT